MFRRLETRLATNTDISLVEVERIRTTISHLTIPPTSLVTTQPETTREPEDGGAPLEDDDSIMTLPEEDPDTQMSPLKRALPRDSVAAKKPLLATPDWPPPRGSSPDQEVVTATVTIGNNVPVITQQTTSRLPRPVDKVPPKTLPKPASPTKERAKTPPKTFPKPKWYIESLQEKQSSPDRHQATETWDRHRVYGDTWSPDTNSEQSQSINEYEQEPGVHPRRVGPVKQVGL